MRSSRNTTIFWLLAAIAVVALFYFFGGEKLKHDWKETYSAASKEPYGTKILVQLLEKFFPGERFYKLNDNDFVAQLSKPQSGSNYVFVGASFHLDSLETQTLLDFVAAGNTAFFSSKTAPFDFLSEILPPDCEGENWLYYESDYRDTSVRLNFSYPDLADQHGFEYNYVLRGAPSGRYLWSFFMTETYCDSLWSDYANLGNIDDQVNYLSIPFGDGTVLLHSTPLVFTNYHLLEEKKLEYVEKVFSYFSEGTIYFDLKRSEEELLTQRRNGRSQSNRPGESPLNFVLAQPPLAWAWYLLLTLGLLYAIFYARRRQRIVPVLEPNANTSLEFIKTIGRLYFQQGSPKQVCIQKMKFLQNHIRERYYLPVKDWDEAFILQLHQKSEVPKELLEKIVFIYKNILNSNFVSEKTLMDFHKLQEEFFKIRK